MNNDEITAKDLLNEQLKSKEKTDEPIVQESTIPPLKDEQINNNNKTDQKEGDIDEFIQMKDKIKNTGNNDSNSNKTNSSIVNKEGDNNIASSKEKINLVQKESNSIIAKKKEQGVKENKKKRKNSGKALKDEQELQTTIDKVQIKKNKNKSIGTKIKPLTLQEKNNEDLGKGNKKFQKDNDMSKSTNDIKKDNRATTDSKNLAQSKSFRPKNNNQCVTEVNCKKESTFKKTKIIQNKERHQTLLKDQETKETNEKNIKKHHKKLSINDQNFISRQEEYLIKKKENQSKLEQQKYEQSKLTKGKATKENINAKMATFREYEIKKQKKLDKLKKEKEDKERKELEEYQKYRKPKQKVNIEESINRMTHDEVKRRSAAHKVLKDIYKPTFKPTTNFSISNQINSQSERKRQLNLSIYGQSQKDLNEDIGDNNTKDFSFENQSNAIRHKLFKHKAKANNNSLGRNQSMYQ